MNLVYLALGANIAPRIDYLLLAVQKLSSLGKGMHCAPLYKSEPYGVADQPWFLNTAAALHTKLSPAALLEAVKEIEQAVGRIPRYRWGPREIDIDILLFNQEIYRDPALQIPHADLPNRRFVLQPLVDLNPNLWTPGIEKNVAELLAECPDQSRLTRYESEKFLHGTFV